MKIIKPSAEILDDLDATSILKKLELCGRICYKSEDKITNESAVKFINSILKNGHESVIEHFSLTVKFIVDRGVSHEIVRHRIGSYSQESTRYCNYSQDKFENEITVIEPLFFDESSSEYKIWKNSCEQSEKSYFDLLSKGVTPEQARTVLPNSLKTELIKTANLRSWRHFLKLRTAENAHPQIREVSRILLSKLFFKLPTIFQDIN